jgi:hypothetical protein
LQEKGEGGKKRKEKRKKKKKKEKKGEPRINREVCVWYATTNRHY